MDGLKFKFEPIPTNPFIYLNWFYLFIFNITLCCVCVWQKHNTRSHGACMHECMSLEVERHPLFFNNHYVLPCLIWFYIGLFYYLIR